MIQQSWEKLTLQGSKAGFTIIKLHKIIKKKEVHQNTVAGFMSSPPPPSQYYTVGLFHSSEGKKKATRTCHLIAVFFLSFAICMAFFLPCSLFASSGELHSLLPKCIPQGRLMGCYCMERLWKEEHQASKVCPINLKGKRSYGPE